MTGPAEETEATVRAHAAARPHARNNGTARPIDGAGRRTSLAADRTIMAAERTYAAWVRTALAALAAGIGARALLKGLVPGWMVLATGTVLIAFAGFCLVAAVWRELRPGAPPPRPNVRRLPVALLAAINGFLLLACLAALVGLWSR